MNIFVTSSDPIECAKFIDNKRVVKMVLESAQMLCTAIHSHGGKAPYKPTHKNHPCNVWVRSTRSNYMWLLRHFKALCEEYTARYGKIHKCQSLYDVLLSSADIIPSGDLTPFANCAANASVGISYKHLEDTLEAYKLYLKERWFYDKIKPKWSYL